MPYIFAVGELQRPLVRTRLSARRFFAELCKISAVEGRGGERVPVNKGSVKARRSSPRHGLIVVSLEGEIRFSSSEVRRWLKRFFPRPPCARTLPRSVYCWMKLHGISRGNRSLVAKDKGARLFIRASRPHPADCIALLVEFAPEPRSAAARRSHGSLTRRENEVLEWIAAGKSNRDMAEILDMSVSTVGKHLERIFCKLGVENRTAAASFYRSDAAWLLRHG